jgi:hypothetical protein
MTTTVELSRGSARFIFDAVQRRGLYEGPTFGAAFKLMDSSALQMRVFGDAGLHTYFIAIISADDVAGTAEQFDLNLPGT